MTACDRSDLGDCAAGDGEDTARQILRHLALGIERMRGNDADRPVLTIAEPGSRHRRVAGQSSIEQTAATEGIRRPEPPVAGVKEPAAVVVREPTPRLAADEGHPDGRIGEPESAVEWRPAEADTVGPPAIAKLAGIEGAVVVERRESRGVIR